MTIAVLCAAILALSIFLLGFWVSIQRTRTGVITGAGEDPTSGLMKAVRAHANASEYAALLIAMMLYLALSSTGGPAFWAEIVIIIVTVSRIMVALGFLICQTLEKPHVFKAVGALGTYIGGAALAVAVALTAL